MLTQACSALAGAAALPQATPILRRYYESMREELQAAAAAEDAADEAAAAPAVQQSGVADLTAQLLDMLPLFQQHAAAAADRALALAAHALTHQHLSVDSPDFVKV